MKKVKSLLIMKDGLIFIFLFYSNFNSSNGVLIVNTSHPYINHGSIFTLHSYIKWTGVKGSEN